MDTPMYSVLICTRNRGASIAATLESVRTNTHPDFEVVVLDQSENDSTLETVRPLQVDASIRYVKSDTQGLGAAHNAGVAACRGEFILITDDDCDVPSDWVAKLASVFEDFPTAGMVFCRVEPADYDPVAGHIPVFLCDDERLVTGLTDLRLGIGAGMAISRKAFDAAGGFDPATGPGGAFPSGEEADTAYRLLVKGFGIVLTNRTHVVHRGFRTWQQISLHTMRDVTGSGAVYAKLARHGSWRFGLFCVGMLGKWGWESVKNLARLRKPHGIRRSAWLIKGFRHGWSAPVDSQTLRFALSPDQASRYRRMFIQRDV